jgi:hypothetical protein
VGQDHGDIPVAQRGAHRIQPRRQRFSRSGSNKKISPIIFAVIVFVAVAVGIWLKTHA